MSPAFSSTSPASRAIIPVLQLQRPLYAGALSPAGRAARAGLHGQARHAHAHSCGLHRRPGQLGARPDDKQLSILYFGLEPSAQAEGTAITSSAQRRA